jgi:ubiquinone/menaquinone biosynthesis C-methylase UbiE/uncharacterized protein YbaR (Trm112 family)
MKEEHVKHLVCPDCYSALSVLAETRRDDGRIETGSLKCQNCSGAYPIVGFVPRFVAADGYAAAFAYEWKIHTRTQYDGSSGVPDSERRFFAATKWPRKLPGEIMLEVGCGSGRFTEQAVSTGAFVVSIDYSSAVEVNYASNGHRENLLIVQADLFRMPFRRQYFDRLYCFGVLQHTPDVGAAFRALLPVVKAGGHVAIDVYDKRWWTVFKTKYWVRPITRRMKHETLYRMVVNYVDRMWPLARLIDRLPSGYHANAQLLIASKRHKYPDADDDWLREWAKLDVFDMLSPTHDHPQTLRTVRRWFKGEGLLDSEVHYGHNGIEARGRIPMDRAS